MTPGRRSISFPQGEPPDWLSNAKWSALKPYAHQQQKLIQQVYLYICEYVCECVQACACVSTCVCAWAQESKKGYQFEWGWEGSREVIREGWENGMDGDKVTFYFNENIFYVL